MLQSTINEEGSRVNKDEICTIVATTLGQKRRKMIATKGITVRPNGTYVSFVEKRRKMIATKGITLRPNGTY
jgi:hypothetical protein